MRFLPYPVLCAFSSTAAASSLLMCGIMADRCDPHLVHVPASFEFKPLQFIHFQCVARNEGLLLHGAVRALTPGAEALAVHAKEGRGARAPYDVSVVRCSASVCARCNPPKCPTIRSRSRGMPPSLSPKTSRPTPALHQAPKGTNQHLEFVKSRNNWKAIDGNRGLESGQSLGRKKGHDMTIRRKPRG